MQDISIEILPKSHNYSTLKVNFPWRREELIAEFEQQEWQPYGMETAVKHEVWIGKRFKVHRPISPYMRQIVEFFGRDSTRDYVIQCLYRDKPMFGVNWQMYPWRMSMNTEMHAEFTKDLPGFENGIHCDMRRLVSTGMIYLNEGNDPQVASGFYDHPMRHNEHIVETGYGMGWIHSNDWNTWHDGWNRSDRVRYSIMIALTLKLQHQPDGSDNPDKPVLV